MMKTAVVYLHGFASADKPGRLTKLQELCPQCDFYSPTYHPHDSKETIAFLKKFIVNVAKNHSSVMLIGNSMGGVWADYFGRLLGLKVIIMNPAVDLGSTKSLVGKHKNFVTGDEVEFTSDHLTDFEKVNNARRGLGHVPRAVLVNKDDPVIPYKSAEDEFKSNSKVIAFDKGGHQWTNWEAVANEINSLRESIIL